ncbi:MAG: DoxX family membrane protein [bacterium]
MIHTYSLFPDFLSYGGLSPLLLRLVLGLILLNLGFLKLSGERVGWIMFLRAMRIPRPKEVCTALGAVEIVTAVLFFAGLYTQAAALVVVILSFTQFFIESREPALLRRDLVFYFLLLTLAASLFITGAGPYAIDLPL